jgi:predicted HAD superfamily Cof-like phosphohydrolase
LINQIIYKIEMQSDYDKVREFTEGAGFKCPEKPQLMNRDEVRFLIKMVLSEMQELADTVTSSSEESVQFMHECVGVDQSKHESVGKSELELIADQADAAVDCWVYLLNGFCKKGVDLSKIFDLVHQSNMAKRDPKTGKFIRRESDGKILKPEGWTAPDILAEIHRQSGI